MKIRNQVLLMALTAGLGLSPVAARAAIDFSLGIQVSSPSDFIQPLSAYGEWVNVGSYGRCWHPTRVDHDWRPYTIGSWEWTDAGWYWQSDEPWAPECYHYGSWQDDPTYGWVWIPGTEWAPAWVTWRSSDDYVGWAPCGPGMAVLPAADFVFTDVHNFHDHRFSGRSDFRINDTTIINRTRVIRNFSHQTVNFGGREQRIVTNPGPGAEFVQRATRTRLQARPIGDVIQRNARPQNLEQRDTRQQQPRDPQQRDQQQRNFQQDPQSKPTPLQPTGRENGNIRPNQQQPGQQPRQFQQQPQNQQRQPEQQRPTEQRQLEQRPQQEQQPRAQSQVVPEPRSPGRPAPNDNPNPPVPVKPRAPQAPAPAPLPPTGRSENGTPLRPPQQPEQRQPQQQPKEQPKAQPQQRQPEQKPQDQQKKERDNSKDSAVKVNWKALV